MLSKTFARGVLSLSAAILTFSQVSKASAFAAGDVFAAVGNSQVDVFTPTGVLITTLNDQSGSAFTAGMAFDSSGNLYVANYSVGTVSKFDSSGTLVKSAYLTGGQSSPESILVEKDGDFLVGGPTPNIYQYLPAGGLPSGTYPVEGGNGTHGADWIDLSSDGRTLLYDDEGTEILSYNLATRTQNAPFAPGLNRNIFAIRIIQEGRFKGDVLAAGGSDAVLIGSNGSVLKTYNLPGNLNGDFSLTLDPNGTDFWTGDTGSGIIWEVNIASGAIDSQFDSGSPGTLFGLVVYGGTTPPVTTPEPAAAGMLTIGLAALVFTLSGKRSHVPRGTRSSS